jgi:hypothetical protein
MTISGARQAGGRLDAAIANQIGKLVADFTGREPPVRVRFFTRTSSSACSRTVDPGSGQPRCCRPRELVRLQRDALQRGIEMQLVAAVDRLTGRTVRTFLSGPSILGEGSVEVFVLEPAASSP